MSTITAISTPPGSGGIAVVRLSGPEAFEIADRAWSGSSLSAAVSHTAHLGKITDEDGSPLDEAVATVFRAPNSFTGEDTVEFSVHGSPWIQRRVVERLVQLGAVPAEAGEFTKRAFMNGRMDLAQAEGVADLIASSSRAAHKLAMTQMSGAFSSRLNELRDKLIELASLLELELDFSEEEVEFADRQKLTALADETLEYIERLTRSYRAGRALKEGVTVAIAGAPNAGKSTLLNRLLDEEKAIVSPIAGTTRDVIEDTREIGGVLFRFFDTAGLRSTDDAVENIGISRARNAIARAAIVVWVIDGEQPELTGLDFSRDCSVSHSWAEHIVLVNKADQMNEEQIRTLVGQLETLGGGERCKKNLVVVSAKRGDGMAELETKLVELAQQGYDTGSELIVTNARHQAALQSGAESLRRAREGIAAGLSADFVAQDLREALHHLGTVTGAVTTDTLLTSIFTKFCIGK